MKQKKVFSNNRIKSQIVTKKAVTNSNIKKQLETILQDKLKAHTELLSKISTIRSQILQK